jgi:TRAP-type C4-dicarboxylate transport system permease large subunit
MVLMIPLFAPAVEAAGLDPVHYGVISVVSLAVGLITPPYGLCLLLASAIAKAPITEGVKELVPFFFGFLVVIILIIYFPQLILWLPGLLL